MFKVIKGIQKEAVNKHDLYYRAYCKVLDNYENNPDQDIVPIIKKLIVYGVKAINAMEKPDIITQEDADFNFKYADIIRMLMANLTPKEFVNLFPIDKKYDGYKYESKDYFYTVDYLKTLDQDQPIGHNIDDFLWDYMNSKLHIFLVKLFSFASDLRRLDGRPGLMEEWADQNGVRTFTIHKDSKGREFMIDKETGKTKRVKKHKPRYLKPVGVCAKSCLPTKKGKCDVLHDC